MKITYFLLIFCFVSSTNAQFPEFFGMTSEGGDNNAGTVFKTDANGESQNLEFSLPKTEGVLPKGSLIEASNGKLYGLTEQGGVDDQGVLFEYNPLTNEYIKKIKFPITGGGYYPKGSLLEASNGKLYGMTWVGGDFGSGVIFEYDPVINAIGAVSSFENVNTGQAPYGSLIQASNGKLYGMTREGGTIGKGVLFEYDILTNVIIKKVDLGIGVNGNYPTGSLLEGSNGKLYGMTAEGGAYDKGVIFEFDPSTNSYLKKIDFDGINYGSNPYSSLIEFSSGKLYGNAGTGGINNYGVLFEYNFNTNIIVKKIDFDGTSKGRKPAGALAKNSNNKLYGTALYGGVNEFGVLFEYDPITDIFVKKIDLDGFNKGKYTWANLMLSSSGNFYGMTQRGGSTDEGILFEYNYLSNTYSKKKDFGGGILGSNPKGSLVEASNSNLYGLTRNGGVTESGVLFEYNPITQEYTKKIDLDGAIKGKYPEGSLIEASNGKLYGMTLMGGVNNYGVLFEYDALVNGFTKKIDFDGVNNGIYPNGSLVEFAGKLYGLTSSGGAFGDGVLFEYDPVTNILINKIDFDGANRGRRPKGTLLKASNGKLYGMTELGGATDLGVLFEYDPLVNNFTKKIDFDIVNNGNRPNASLIESSNGKLYGMTSWGGINNYGVLFEYDFVSNTYIKRFDFDGLNNGRVPYSSLFEASNGKLYGMAFIGGASNKGVMFEYDPIINSFTKKLDFNRSNGEAPYGNLVEVNACYLTYSINATECTSYTVPSGDETYTTIGTYNVMDTLLNDCGNDNVLTISLTILPAMAGIENSTICGGDSVVVNGTTYNANNSSGVEIFSNIGPYGCDSTVTINLNVLPIIDLTLTTTSSSIISNESGATYQWLDCNNFLSAISGEQSATYNVTSNGSYAVEITVGSCVDTSMCEVMTELSVEENEIFSKVSIYPNPNKGTVNVELANLQDVSIKLFSVKGKLLQEYHNISIPNYQFTLDGSKGVYFIEISSKGKMKTFKVFKE